MNSSKYIANSQFKKAIKEANNSVLSGNVPNKEDTTKQFIKSVYEIAETLHVED